MKLKEYKMIFVGIFLVVTFIIISASSFVDNSQGNFGNGIYYNAEFNDSTVMLKYWNESEQELPNNHGVDSFGINMTGNVLLMHMNEASGAIIDSSGNGDNGTQLGGVTYDFSGKLNSAMNFDGVDDYIEVNSVTNKNTLDGANTIMGWIKLNDWTGSKTLFSAHNLSSDSSDRRYLVIDFSSATQQFRVVTSKSTPGSNTVASLGTYTGDSDWHYLAAVIDANAGITAFYVDGINQGSDTTNSFSLSTLSSSYIGQLAWSSPNISPLNGTIDEVAIFNRSLSSSEILKIYQRQKGNYGGGNLGNYTSQIFNAGASAVWENISWLSNAIGELPDNGATETKFGSGNANMTGNVLLYHLNEANGAIVDSSGSGNNGAQSGGVSYGVSGKLNTAIGFDGTNDSIILPTTLLKFGTSDFSFSFWIKRDSVGVYDSLIWYDSGETDGAGDWWFRFENDNTLRFLVDTGASSNSVQTTDAYTNDIWYNVVVVRDSGSTIKIYVNGNEAKSAVDSGFNIAGTTVTSNLAKVGSGYFNGTMDEFSIWNRSLSTTEILDIYKRGIVRLNLTARSCDDSACSGENWVDINDASPQNLSLTNNQYFQYKFNFETDDSSYTSELYNVSINYNVAPSIPVLNSPANNSPINVSFALLNTTLIDINGDNMTVWFYGDGSVINTTSANNGSLVTYNWTALSESLHNWSVIVNDGSLNTSSDVYFFNVDVSIPSVVLVHPEDNQTFVVNESVAISLNITDVSSIDTIIANVTLENGSVVQVSDFSNGLQSDNFESNSLGTNWVKTNITSGNQNCIVNINETVPGKMFISINGTGGSTSAQCGVNSAKKVDGNFDVNISFNLTSFEDDTLFSFRSNSLDSFLPAGVRVFTDIERRSGASKYTLGYNNGTSTAQQSVSTTDSYGKFRIRRFNSTGTPVFNLYYFNNSNSSWVNLLGNISLSNSKRTQYIQIKPSSTASNYGVLNVTLDDFLLSSDNFMFGFFNATSYVGRYNLSIFVNDSFGFVNDSESSYFLTDVSNHAPSRPFLTNPDPGDVIRNVISISWSTVLDQEGDSLRFNISLLNSDGSFNLSIVSNYGNSSSTSYSWNTSLFPEGIYGLKIKVFENETAEGLSDTETLAGNLTIDNSVPDNPILNYPANNSNLSASSVLLNATLSNPDGRSMTVWFYGDGILLDTLSGIVSGSSITYYWTSLSESLHNWSVVGYDGVYNSSTVNSFFTVDSVASVVNLMNPTNNSEELSSNTVLFNYNVSDVTTNISNCSLYVNGNSKKINSSIIESANNSFSVYLYKGYYNWSISCYDSAGNLGMSDLYYLNVSLQAPTVNLTSPALNYSLTNNIIFNCSATDNSNLVNISLYGNWSGGWHLNETKSLTGTSDSVAFNKTISDGNYVWNCLAYDNSGLSDYYFNGVNKTLTIDTVIPSVIINSPVLIENVRRLEKILNVTISEMGSIWYNLNNLGNVSLCSDCLNGVATLNFTDYGNHSVIVYVNDSLGNVNSSSLNFVLNLDSDGDGIIDPLDSDDDNDGIADMSDNLNGNLSNVFSNIAGLNLSVNGSSDLTSQFNGLLHVNFSEGNKSLVEFDYNFSEGRVLNLGEVIIEKQKENLTGSILVKGVNLTRGRTKSVYVDDLNSSFSSVCVKDAEIGLISEISGDCSGTGEVRVSCDSTLQSGFNCTDLGSRYKISGLSHSGIIEIGNASVVVDTGNGGSSGGGSNNRNTQKNVTNNISNISVAVNDFQKIVDKNISKKLFDIRMDLEDTSIRSSKDLVAVVIYESFGLVPTPVNLTFEIFDLNGNLVYLKNGFIIVTVKKIRKYNFPDLVLKNGRYEFVFTTVYNKNISDKFRSKFEVKSRRSLITGNVVDFVSGKGGLWGLVLILILIIFLFFKVVGDRILIWMVNEKLRNNSLKKKESMKKIRGKIGGARLEKKKLEEKLDGLVSKRNRIRYRRDLFKSRVFRVLKKKNAGEILSKKNEENKVLKKRG